MDRKTARKYVKEGRLPSELQERRALGGRGRIPSTEVWPEVEAQLEKRPRNSRPRSSSRT